MNIPKGWKLVPVDATRSMIDAASEVEEDGYDAMHKAMLEASPPPTLPLSKLLTETAEKVEIIPFYDKELREAAEEVRQLLCRLLDDDLLLDLPGLRIEVIDARDNLRAVLEKTYSSTPRIEIYDALQDAVDKENATTAYSAENALTATTAETAKKI